MKKLLPTLLLLLGISLYSHIVWAQCPSGPAVLEAPTQTKYCSGERLGMFEYQPINNGDGTIIELDFNGHVQTIGTPGVLPASPFVFFEDCGSEGGYYTVSILCAQDKTLLTSVTLVYEVFDIPDEGIDFSLPNTETCDPAINQICEQTQVVYGLSPTGPFFDFVPDVDAGETVTIYYQVKATNGPANCISRGNYTMNCLDNCVSNVIAYNDGPICEGEGVNLEATFIEGATYTWSGPNDFSATGNNLYVTDIQTGIYTVQVTVPGCEDIEAATIIQLYEKPNPSLTKGVTDLCAPAYDIVYSVEGIYESYFWSVTGGTLTSGQGTSIVTIDWETVGEGTVNLQVTDDNGCSASLFSPLEVDVMNSPVEPVLTDASVLHVCVGETATIVPTGAIDWLVYEYYLEDGVTHATEAPNMTVSEEGYLSISNVQNAMIVYMQMIEMDYEYCESELVPVFISLKHETACNETDPCENPSIPTLSPVASTTYCGTQQGITYSLSQDDFETYQWEISGGTITNGQGTNNITVDWTNIGIGMVQVTVTDANGCTSELQTPLEINIHAIPANPTVNTTSSTLNVCGGNTATINLNNIGADNTYQFFLNDQVTPASNNSNITDLGDGNLVINNVNNSITIYAQVYSHSEANCASDLVPIQVGVLPTEQCVDCPSGPLTATNDGPICEFGSVQFTASNIAGATYTWTGPGNFSSNQQNPFLSNPQAGVYTVTTNIPNCSSLTATSELVVHPLPQPNLVQYTTQLCIPATDITYSINEGFATYDWTVAGGTITSGNGTNSITVDWNFEGQGSVNVLVTNTNNCASALNIPLNVQLESCTEECPPPSQANAGEDAQICETLGNYTLGALTPNSGDGSWTIISQPSATANISNPQFATTPITGLTTPGVYVFAWTVSNDCGESTSDTVEILVESAPSISIAGDPETTCTTICFLAAEAVTHGTGYWTTVSAQPGTNPVIEEPNEHLTNVINLTAPGEYIFRWIVTNGPDAACPDYYDDMLVIVAAPIAASDAIYQCSVDGSTYTVQTVITGGTGTYTVEPANAGFFTGNVFQSYPITSGTAYQFHFADDSYCEGTSINGVYDNCTQIIAVDDVDSTAINTPVTVSVLNNDFNAGNFSITDYTEPGHGTLSFDPVNQTFTFLPDDGFTGVVTFNYTITNEAGDTDTATVTITIVGDVCEDAIVIEQNRICENGQEGSYDLVFNISGGQAPYSVTGSYQGVVQENEVISIPLRDGVGYSLTVIDANACEQSIVEQDFVPCTKLGVDLIDFGGTVETFGNNIYWVIAVQENNDYFLLEHSTNGIDFEVIYKEKGDIDNFMTMTYGFLHKSAGAGVHYYRLHQIDISGEKTNLGTIRLKRGEQTLSITQIYPVPAIDDLFLDFVIPKDAHATISIYNLIGAEIAQKRDWYEAGQYLTNFKVNDYPDGVYFIILESEGKRVTSRFVKE